MKIYQCIFPLLPSVPHMSCLANFFISISDSIIKKFPMSVASMVSVDKMHILVHVLKETMNKGIQEVEGYRK